MFERMRRVPPFNSATAPALPRTAQMPLANGCSQNLRTVQGKFATEIRSSQRLLRSLCRNIMLWIFRKERCIATNSASARCGLLPWMPTKLLAIAPSLASRLPCSDRSHILDIWTLVLLSTERDAAFALDGHKAPLVSDPGACSDGQESVTAFSAEWLVSTQTSSAMAADSPLPSGRAPAARALSPQPSGRSCGQAAAAVAVRSRS
mmetsp:Transcript_66316/g.187420  ORF Transcript_66316/g.187420 Transcript_66316/m.187420 type:complete len:206 (+) Transcript_66316:130-747(+)